MNDREQRMSGQHDCGGDAAAYVLGALEPDEARAFEGHLQECAVCRDEVEVLQRVTGALPMAAPQYEAPRRLRRRVLKAVREERPAVASRAPRLGIAWPRSVGAGAFLAAAAAAVVAALVLTLGGGGTRVIAAQVAGVTGTAELRVSGGHGELVVRGMTPPPRGDVYEVWLQRPGQRLPSPTNVLFSVTRGGSAEVGLPDRLRGITQVMVTPEPAGGSRVPTHSPVIVARLT